MEYGLYVDYEWCSGCHACELACKQEHDLKTDEWGIRVVERTYRGKEKVADRVRAHPHGLLQLLPAAGEAGDRSRPAFTTA